MPLQTAQTGISVAEKEKTRDIPPQGHSVPCSEGPFGLDVTAMSAKDDSRYDGQTLDAAEAATPERPLKQALFRGWRTRCPNCGQGPMLKDYLKVRSSCPVCGEDLSHARADDGPAYLTILIVGKLLAPILIWSYTTFRPDPVILGTILTVGCVALSLYLLPRMKGIVVAFQWAKRMHGF